MKNHSNLSEKEIIFFQLLNEFFVILAFNNISSLKLQLEKLLKDEDSRQEYIDTCYKAVCNGHTYYHIAAQVFNYLGEKHIAESLSHYIGELTS